MLTIVAFRNLVELTVAEIDVSEGLVLPTSFGWFKGHNLLWTISYVRPRISSRALTVVRPGIFSPFLVSWSRR